VLEGLSLIPVVAGAALALLQTKMNRKKAVALVLLWHLILVGQYAFCAFSPSSVIKPAMYKKEMERYIPVSTPLERYNPLRYRVLLSDFSDQYDRFFKGRQEVRLGIVVDSKFGFNVAPYLLRTSNKPIKVFMAAMPDAPELGQNLDAVLFIPSQHTPHHSAAVLENEKEYYKEYVENVFHRIDRLRLEGRSISFEGAIRRLNDWKSGQVIEIGKDLRLFLPRKQ